MKIGILTFHCAHNYGAVLQAYATQEYLLSKGYDVEIIDYRPDYLIKPYEIFNLERIISNNPLKSIKQALAELSKIRTLLARKKGFDHFIHNKLKLSEKVVTTIPAVYDAYIFGSDQIWNPKISKSFDHIYFGDFATRGDSRLIAYAASMEASELSESQKKHYKSSLDRFTSISVREFQLQQMLQSLTKKKISTVLDPTLLVKREIWERLAIKPKIKQKYVLVYQVRPNRNTIRIASEIAQRIGGVVVHLVSNVKLSFDKYKYQFASPEEYIGWFLHADHVVTTSFHGTAFSIIFNKPFYTLNLKDGHDSRSHSLLKNLNLLNRFIPKESEGETSPVDFTIANNFLQKLRAESQQFLLSSLEDSIEVEATPAL